MGITISTLITPLAADEWALFRTLRLNALAESPDAFSPTLEETQRIDEASWRKAAARFASSRGVLLIARPDLGLMSATVDENEVGHIGAMWVSPNARNQHIGAQLLDDGLAHLDTLGCLIIELSVTETNERAQALYQSRGFVLTGEDEALREGSSLRNLFMRKDAR